MFRVAASPVGRRQALSPSAPDPLAVRAVSVARRVGPSSSQPRPSCPQSLSPSTAESSPLSHVIPPRLFQTLNSQRWNCNVLRRSRKVTVGNYVRHYSVRSGGPAAARAVPALVRGEWAAVRGVWWAVCGAGLVHLSCSPRVPQPLGPLSISHVIPPRQFQTLNSQRWNCNVLRRSRKVTVGNYVRGYSVRSGGIFGKCDGLNVSEPTGILATARGCPCRRVVPWAYLHVITTALRLAASAATYPRHVEDKRRIWRRKTASLRWKARLLRPCLTRCSAWN